MGPESLTGGQQFKHVMSRVGRVFEDVCCSSEAAYSVKFFYGGQRAAEDAELSSRAAGAPRGDAVCYHPLDGAAVEGQQQLHLQVVLPESPQEEAAVHFCLELR